MKTLNLIMITLFTIIALTACGDGDEYHFHSHTHIDFPDEDAGTDSQADAGHTEPDADVEDDANTDARVDVGSDANPDTGNEDVRPDTGVVPFGNFTVNRSPLSPPGDIVLGSIADAGASIYRFGAEDEGFVVDTITLVNCIGYNGDGDCQDSGETPGNDRAVQHVHVSYMNTIGNYEKITTSLENGVVEFHGLDIYVPADTVKDVSISVTTNSPAVQRVESGDRFALSIVDAGVFTHADGSTTRAEFNVVGLDSNAVVTDFGGDSNIVEGIPASAFELRQTVPTVSLSFGSPSGAAVPGFEDIFQMNVSADARGFVTMEKVIFSIETSDANYGGDPDSWTTCGSDGFNDPNKWNLRLSGNAGSSLLTDADWKFFNQSGEPCADGDQLHFVQVDLTQMQNLFEIEAGSTRTLVLEADTTGASPVDDDSIRVKIPSEETVDNISGFNPDIHHAFQWGDDVYANGIDGTYARRLPVHGPLIVY